MIARLPLLLATATLPFWPVDASAFRTCDIDNSYAYSASTRYVVAEVVFDWQTGSASGTKTIYNYANHTGEGSGECHVTYELSGSYTPGSGTFVLDAHRTNASQTCSVGLLEGDYPVDLTYALQMEFGSDGEVIVRRADNGELFAEGSWAGGKTVYKTAESCTYF